MHAHYGLCGVLAAGLRATPLVISFLGDDVLGTPGPDGQSTRASRWIAAAGRWAARRARAVIVKSAGLARALGVPGAHVVPNGVDLEHFRPLDRAACRRELALAPDRPLVLFAGDPRLPVKRFELARGAIERARADAPGVELLPLVDVARERVPALMNAVDCMLLTSRHEGSPNTVKEALACGLPVVAVDVGDVAERLAGVAPSAVAAADPAALAAALVGVLRAGTRSNGRDRVRDLSLAAVAQRIIAIYEQVL